MSIDGVKNRGWRIVDRPGKLRWINKDSLICDECYQRTAGYGKVLELANSWSWIACGTLTVAARGGDRFYVIDGGTRAEAARKRSDIIDLPCIVFDTETIKEEAAGFVRVNTSRTYLPSVARYKAELVAEDPDARFVDRLLVSKGILVKKKASKGRETEAIATCIRMAKKDKRNFELVISLASQLCVDRPITHTLLDGLFYLSKNLVTKINDPKLENRILKVGAESLELQAIRSRQILGKGGPRIYAEGMLSEINKHLREKFRLKNETS